MRRAELEHTIRAATEIVGEDSIIVIGSQAILGSYPENDLPTQATQSIEVDMAPLNDDDAESLATRLDGALGEWSLFHQTHGYYVQGVGRKTARSFRLAGKKDLCRSLARTPMGAPASAWIHTTCACPNWSRTGRRTWPSSVR